MSELDLLERALRERAHSTPDAGLRARVLDALERERRGERHAGFAAAAACWLVAGLCGWAADTPAPEAGTRGSVAAEFARGPDLAHVPRLARPLGPDGRPLP